VSVAEKPDPDRRAPREKEGDRPDLDRPAPRENERDRRVHHERPHGAFRRTLTLPKSADGENVDASLKDGVLRIRVPKKSPETRRIEVRSHS
jgi:HSP20 family protein